MLSFCCTKETNTGLLGKSPVSVPSRSLDHMSKCDNMEVRTGWLVRTVCLVDGSWKGGDFI